MMRVLILCTHNSARSQMAEGWVRHYARELRADIDVASAGTERTRVKPEAVQVMREVGIDLSGHTSKSLDMLPDPWAFDVVVTVCDSANEACPVYPAETTRLHVSFPDPSGQGLNAWREVRDALGGMSRALVETIVKGETPKEKTLLEAGKLPQMGFSR
jgi:arsenate reductase